MKHFPRRHSVWDGERTAPLAARSGRDPIDPERIERLRKRGMTYRAIGIQIAKEDGRKVPYTSESVSRALYEYRKGNRDSDGERSDWLPATNRNPPPISVGSGIGMILFRKSR